MIELIQFPWSPFCLVQRHILRFAGVRFKTTNLQCIGDRARIWKLTKARYYGVPILRDGTRVVFETDETSQVIGKYLDRKFKLNLFPREREGEQIILWQYLEGEIESLTFKLNDIYYREFVAQAGQLSFLRHKERKFGRGCIEAWRAQRASLLAGLVAKLTPFERMVTHRPFLLRDRPSFVDFDLLGLLDNFLYSGHYAWPARLPQLHQWYCRITAARLTQFVT